MVKAITITLVVYLGMSAAIAALVYDSAFRSELRATLAAGSVRLSEASARLTGQLDVFRTLVNLIAVDTRVADAMIGADAARLEDLLKNYSLTYGAWEIDLVGQDAKVLASSHPEREGLKFSRSLVGAAFNGSLGFEHGVDAGQRLVRFSRALPDAVGLAPTAVVVSASIAGLEYEWPVVPEPIVFLDDARRAISSNRPDLILLAQADASESAFPLLPAGSAGPLPLWTFTQPGDAPKEVLLIERDIPRLAMSAQVLLDTADARAVARLRMVVALALLGLLGLIGAVVFEQRRRLAFETRQSSLLEARVEERTRELKAAQSELVEASKLAALGRLSAGVSHELNQPLAAILNFAENGKRLIERTRPDEAAQNLGLISDQVRRITRIIGNLRAFARQEAAPSEVIELRDVVESALNLMSPELDAAEVSVTADLPARPFPVMAGRVRLEQVLMNLISNAIDAMRDSDRRDLSISLTSDDMRAALVFRDSGSGIANPDRVFEPFYTTKELGASKGLGMGLALSHGIIARFGGQLTCRNVEDGAAFTVEMPIATP